MKVRPNFLKCIDVSKLSFYFCRKKIRNFMANLPAYKWWARLSFLFFISLLMSFFSATVINERSNYFHLASSFPQKMFHCSLKHNWLNWKILRPSKSNLISKLVPTTQVIHIVWKSLKMSHLKCFNFGIFHRFWSD